MVLIWSVTLDNKNHKDKIFKEIHSGDYQICLTGQNFGLQDHLIIDSIEKKELIKIYYRFSNDTDFIYLGESSNSSILKKRSKEIGKESDINERLKVKVIIEKNKVINKELKSKYTGVYKYKKEIIRTNNINKTCNLASAIIKF